MERLPQVRILLLDENRVIFDRLTALLQSRTGVTDASTLPRIQLDYEASGNRAIVLEDNHDLYLMTPELACSLGLSWVSDTFGNDEASPLVICGPEQSRNVVNYGAIGAIDFVSIESLDFTMLARLVRYAHRFHKLKWALKESRARFHCAVESLAEGIIITDSEGRITFVNSAMSQITGYTAGEMGGKFVHEIFHSSEDSANSARIEDMKRRYQDRLRGISERYEIDITRKDGKRRRVSVHASPLRDVTGEIIGGIGVNTDVTEIRELEQQLLWSQKMEAVGRLAGGVAHDFNNLLTAILGYSDLILRDLPKTDPNLRRARIIKQSSEAACALTRRLLTISRRGVVQKKRVLLDEVVNENLAIIQGLAGEQIIVEIRKQENLAPVDADVAQLQQVLMNLVINARDAMPRGGKLTVLTRQVTLPLGMVTARSRLKPGTYIVLSVEDTGHGMTQEVLSHLFEPFFTTKKGLGTGLGLSTVYGVVKQHEGEVLVESEVGRGSRFEVYFPAAEGVEATKGVVEMDIGLLSGSEIVLLAEDQEAVRGLIRSVLEGYGYTVLEAQDGKHALDIARHTAAIDLLLTDVAMPYLNGLELARELMTQRPGLPVLFMSGYTDDSTVPETIRRMGASFIEKPFSPLVLVHNLRSVLDSAHSSAKAVSVRGGG